MKKIRFVKRIRLEADCHIDGLGRLISQHLYFANMPRYQDFEPVIFLRIE